jgi:rubrerythrin
MNRTGTQMSSFDSSAMQAVAPSVPPMPSGDGAAIGALRSAYIHDAEPVGSMPMSGTTSVTETAGTSAMAGNGPQIFLDKLGERLAFERTGTRLYDALITKFDAAHDDMSGMRIEDIRKIRADEVRHFSIVAGAIETLGGDPTAETPSADLAGVESQGLVQVLTDPRTTLAQSLHAILTAELVDECGWEVLVALAQENQQATMLNEFTIALGEEREHLRQVRQWYEEAALGSTLSGTASVGDAQMQTP